MKVLLLNGSPHKDGCVAVEESVMKQIVRWARDGAKIVIQRG